MKYEYNSTSVDIPLEGHTNIGIRFSGGADSSILLALICETIMRLGIQNTSKVYAMTVYWDPPVKKYYSSSVIEYIKSIYSSVDITHILTPCEYPWQHMKTQQKIMSDLYSGGDITIAFSGVTKNPPGPEVGWGDSWELRDRDRDSDDEKCFIIRSDNLQIVRPFIQIDKRGVSDMYKLLNLQDSLFPITWSCEGATKVNNYYQKHCGECWWCKEREWGFGRLE